MDTPTSRRPAWTHGLELLAVAGLLIAHVCLSWTAQRRMSATFDEPVHLLAGRLHLAGRFGLNYEHPPLVKQLFALPARAADVSTARVAGAEGHHRSGWHAAQRSLDDRLLRRGRAVALGLACLLLLVVWAFGRCAFGVAGGLTALALCAGSPTLLAHGALTTLDVPLALFVLAAALAAWVGGRRTGGWLAVGLLLGAALATKHSALATLPVFGLWLALRPPPRPGWAGLLAVCGIAAVLLGAYHGPSGLRWYWAGLADLPRYRDARPPAYLVGQLSADGFAAYYAVALAIKLPLPLLLLGSAGLLTGLMSPTTRMALALPTALAAVLVAAATASGMNLGIRYVLLVVPLLALGVASLLARPGRARWSVAALCVAWLAVETSLAWPHYLSFFNRPARAAGHDGRLLLDSNLDWGQDLGALADWVAEQPVDVLYLAYFGTSMPEDHDLAVRLLPGFGRFGTPSRGPRPTPPRPTGRRAVAISLNHLRGLYVTPPDRYAWLQAFPLIGRAGRSIRIYEIGDDPFALGELAAALWDGPQPAALARELATLPPTARDAVLDRLHGSRRYTEVGPRGLARVLVQVGDLHAAEFELLLACQGPEAAEAWAEVAEVYFLQERLRAAVGAMLRARRIGVSPARERWLQALEARMRLR